MIYLNGEARLVSDGKAGRDERRRAQVERQIRLQIESSKMLIHFVVVVVVVVI
jgi:hypothetical protein